jgi:hypothetical protein
VLAQAPGATPRTVVGDRRVALVETRLGAAEVLRAAAAAEIPLRDVTVDGPCLKASISLVKRPTSGASARSWPRAVRS